MWVIQTIISICTEKQQTRYNNNNNNNNIIIINCSSVDTRWQWLFYMYTKYDIDYY
jgi:hypothetical protein